MLHRMQARRQVAGLVAVLLSATFAFSHVAGAEEPKRGRQAVPTSVTAQPAASSPQGAPVPSGWLAAFNHYRNLAELPPVSEDTVTQAPPGSGFTWSDGARKHSEYMVFEGITHEEDPSKGKYTEEGDLAGRNGNVMTSSRYETTAREAIEAWITAPFHAIGMLDGQLAQTGYGQYKKKRQGNQFGATVDVIRGRAEDPIPGVSFPIRFPGPGATVYLDRYPGGEMPDPLWAGDCAGYSAPTGLPVYLMLDPSGPAADYEDSTFGRGTTELDHCAYDATGHPDALARDVMATRNAIVLIPRRPLGSEKTYEVSIEANGEVFSWSFSTGDTKPPKSKVLKPANNKVYDRDKLKKMTGTASGESRRVDVSIAGYVGNQKCRFLKGDGSFTPKRDCFDHRWLKAKGRAEWSRGFGRKLPPSYNPTKGGQIYEIKYYYALSRATDEVGNVERTSNFTGDWTIFHLTP